MPEKSLEKELIACAFNHIKERKTLYILIDEAHLLEMHVLRKLRLLFEQLIYMDVMNAVFAGAKNCPKKTQFSFVWSTGSIALFIAECEQGS